MPIIKEKEESWLWYQGVNMDDLSRSCVDIAKEVMRLLDTPGHETIDADKLIIIAAANINESGITGAMTGEIADMISRYHSRSKEFREKWNLSNQINHEGERANILGDTLNPAFMKVKEN